MSSLKKQLYDLCIEKGFKVGTYISTNAILYSNNIDDGCFISPGCIVGPKCKLGKGNYIGYSTLVPHDNIIGDFNHISSSVVLGGFVEVRNFCFLGLHCTVRDNIRIADKNLIGSAANVLKSIVSQGGVYVGNPARQLDGKVSDNVKI